MVAAGYRVRLAGPGDAPDIAALVRRCYGADYADRGFLDPVWVGRALRAGEATFALAEDRAGRHVGQCALRRLNRAGLFEHSKAIVVPEHRGRGLMGAMSRVLLEEEAPRLGAELLLGHSVTTHVFTQACTRRAGYEPLGLLLGMWPARCVAERDPEGPPVSCLLEGLQVGKSPRLRRLTLQGEWLELARGVLSPLGIPWEHTPARGFFRPLAFDVRSEPALELVHASFGPGGDRRLSELARLADPAARTMWADVPAEHPQAPRLLDTLHGLGFSFAAYVPFGGPQGEDVVRLQRYRDQPVELSDLRLLDHSRPLCARVLAQASSEEVAA